MWPSFEHLNVCPTLGVPDNGEAKRSPPILERGDGSREFLRRLPNVIFQVQLGVKKIVGNCLGLIGM